MALFQELFSSLLSPSIALFGTRKAHKKHSVLKLTLELDLKSGKKHLSWLFTYYVDGKQRCKYVPKDKVKTMQEALTNGRKLEQLILESGLEILKKRKSSSSK